eukprot:SAG31_NODE_1050_length_10160_cov_3.844648_4_plen_339_part_00
MSGDMQLQMQAGVTGINSLRIYNVTKQGHDHDRDGKFIRAYIPELRNVPLRYIHEPWKMPLKVQEAAGCRIGAPVATEKDRVSGSQQWYPAPVVDIETSGRYAREQITAVARQPLAKALAREVFLKHGSRRGSRTSEERTSSGLRPTTNVEVGSTADRRRGQSLLQLRPAKAQKDVDTATTATLQPGGQRRKREHTLDNEMANMAKIDSAKLDGHSSNHIKRRKPGGFLIPAAPDSAIRSSLFSHINNTSSVSMLTDNSIAVRVPTLAEQPPAAALMDHAALGIGWHASLDGRHGCSIGAQAEKEGAESWGCRRCTFKNHPALSMCELCEFPRRQVPE